MPGTTPMTRRRLTTGELAVWRALVDTTAQLRTILGARLLQDTGLTPADYQVLLALSETRRRRMRSSRLASAIDWERSRLSHHLARMERRGLIGRDDCATDSRGAEVFMTEAGADAFRRATAPHARAIKQHFADALTPEQIEALAEILHALRTHLRPEPGSRS
jgi:DNA-binding MarR family transcriptional regulator